MEKEYCLNQIKEQIETKSRMLLERKKYLETIIHENQFLGNVRNDYLKYNNYIIEERLKQIQALEFLNKYIDDLIISGRLTRRDLNNKKKERKKIIDEILLIKNNLDNIINNINK
jgi:hypothetical protein